MSIGVYINGKEIVLAKATWSAVSGVDMAKQFHDLARIVHHAIDKAFKYMTTDKQTVGEGADGTKKGGEK